MRFVEMNEDKKQNLSTPVCVCARHSGSPARASITPECVFALHVDSHTNTHRGRLDSDFPFIRTPSCRVILHTITLSL